MDYVSIKNKILLIEQELTELKILLQENEPKMFIHNICGHKIECESNTCHTFTKDQMLNNDNIVLLGKSGLYLVEDILGEIVYIGVSRDLKRRLNLKTHHAIKNFIYYISNIYCIECDFNVAECLETTLIKTINPKFNIQKRSCLANLKEEFEGNRTNPIHYNARPKKILKNGIAIKTIIYSKEGPNAIKEILKNQGIKSLNSPNVIWQKLVRGDVVDGLSLEEIKNEI